MSKSLVGKFKISKAYREMILDRDGWVCHLCLGSIDHDRTHPDPMAGVADHLVPVIRGGRHTRGNLAAAHAACNLNRAELDLDLARTARAGWKP